LVQNAGSCRAFQQHWYHDSSDGYCKSFQYGGCGGNDNRFETEQLCRLACDANTPIGESKGYISINEVKLRVLILSVLIDGKIDCKTLLGYDNIKLTN